MAMTTSKYRCVSAVFVPELGLVVNPGDIVEHGSPALKGANADLFEKADSDESVTYAARHRKAAGDSE